ncbi:hypothetical protein OH77DRAFT_967607 [Trametes cingulata]|nr:hypothetical protein OH77DRAFT_967607 [Trametes cingulata]
MRNVCGICGMCTALTVRCLYLSRTPSTYMRQWYGAGRPCVPGLRRTAHAPPSQPHCAESSQRAWLGYETIRLEGATTSEESLQVQRRESDGGWTYRDFTVCQAQVGGGCGRNTSRPERVNRADVGVGRTSRAISAALY